MEVKYEDLSSSGRELYLHLVSTREAHEAFLAPRQKCLQRHWLKGGDHFNLDRACRLMEHAAADAAKDYTDVHGGMSQAWHKLFPPSDRRAVAEVLARSAIAELRIGNRFE